MESTEDNCCICFRKDSVVVLFECNHFICQNCLPSFLFLGEIYKKCPVCLSEIKLFLAIESTELGNPNLLAEIYGSSPKLAHYGPKPKNLQVILWLPSDSVNSYSALMQRRNSLVFNNCLLKSLSTCPLCEYEHLSMEYMFKHLMKSHSHHICRFCPKPDLMPPAFYIAYDEKSLKKHFQLNHEPTLYLKKYSREEIIDKINQ